VFIDAIVTINISIVSETKNGSFIRNFIRSNRVWGSSVTIVIRLWVGRSWGLSQKGRGRDFFSSPPCLDRHWDPPSLLSSGYRGPFPWW